LGGLGRFLIDGLAQADYAQTAGGAILVCLLALVADGVLALVQRVIVSPGVSGRRRRRREIIPAPGKDMGHGNVAHTTSA
jgi:osmoprotectant transport system permease protein